MTTRYFSAILVGFLLVLSNCSSDEDGTVESSFSITSLSPDTGQEGSLVVISGKGFSPLAEDNIVKFNGIDAVIQLNSTTEIAAIVPPGAATGPVTVTIGGKTTTGPVFTIIKEQEVTKTYYLKFKVNGTAKIYQDGNPGYQSCGQCACSYMPVLSETRSAGVDICNDEPSWITATHIESWNAKKILFSGSFPIASFSFEEDGIYYSSENVMDQTGSEVNIASVEADGEFAGKKGYKVSGTFKCKVAEDLEKSPLTITEGTFVIRYSED